ncbi:pentatricopeptide repeat-containing protein At1g43980, mitochondrial-like isoform X2 [Salvia splendens]|uniref:pentatricopeptide repeat-containing protein At1g43980, mitochondrial-like isoform X2 n=1 Tax=Salvia splendens TaxID=180675 RepID=UPI001C276163|nr:pentatricopeptide repeat-containing protein At1g43980, mitochondrial-like isoform X2 [Salvia splendens]
MFNLLQKAHRFHHTVSFFSGINDQCSSLKSPSNSLKLVHAQLVKIGLNFSNVYLGNRCVDLYFKSGSPKDAVKVFDDMSSKNIFSWNLYLKVLVKCSDMATARRVFDEMPERDAVSWNTVISGDHAKEMHCRIVKKDGCYSNLVVGNSLIDMYGKLGLVDYSLAVFLSMERVDVISWNAMISGCCTSGYERFAFHQFWVMRSSGFEVDEYTVSAVLTACSNLRNLEKGKQMFCFSTKMGFHGNAVVCSAAIDLFSKCNRLGSALRVFKESHMFDSAVYNAMIACHASHNMEENAFDLFVYSLRESIRLTEFTLSSVLHSAAVFVPVEQACSYGGLLEEGMAVFSSMPQQQRGVVPTNEHYNCVVNMMIRSGLINEAIYFLYLLQWEPDSRIWESLLLACGDYENLELMETIADRLMELEPHSPLPYLSYLANTYEKRGRWESVVRLRRKMEKVTRKEVADISWIGIKGHTYSFEANPTFHHGRENVCSILGFLKQDMSTGDDNVFIN